MAMRNGMLHNRASRPQQPLGPQAPREGNPSAGAWPRPHLEDLVALLLDVAQGVEFLHSKNIIHGGEAKLESPRVLGR